MLMPFIPPIAAAAVTPVAIEYITNTQSSSDSTSYTFSSQSIGAASSDRVVLVAIGSRSNSARSMSGVTIGGVSATEIGVANNENNGADIVALYALNVASGTTANIVVTFSGSMLRCAIGVYAMTGTGGSTTPSGSVEDTYNSAHASDSTIDCPADGAILAAAWAQASTSTVTWTGLTEDFDIQPETASNGLSGAHDEFAAAQTNVAVTATAGTLPNRASMVIASWGPA